MTIQFAGAIGGNKTVEPKSDGRPSESQRDSVFGTQLDLANNNGDIDIKTLGHVLKADLSSGLLSRMRGALQKLGNIASSVAPQEMPETIELDDVEAGQIAVALSQNIVAPTWKEGPWEAADAARSSIDDLAQVLANGAISLSDAGIAKILDAIDTQGQKSVGLGGIKDFVAYGKKKIAQAKEQNVTMRALRAAAEQEGSANTTTVGDASNIAAGAEVGGRKAAGPESLFAMMVAEKTAKPAQPSTPSWKLGHEADNKRSNKYHQMNSVGFSAFRGNKDALPVMKKFISAELKKPGTNNAFDLVKMARSGMDLLKSDGSFPLTQKMQANLLKGLQDDLHRNLDRREVLAGHELSKMVEDLSVAVGWGALGVSDAELKSLVSQLRDTAAEIHGEPLNTSWDVLAKSAEMLAMARAESAE